MLSFNYKYTYRQQRIQKYQRQTLITEKSWFLKVNLDVGLTVELGLHAKRWDVIRTPLVDFDR